MANPEGKCPLCESAVTDMRFHAEESLVSLATGSVEAAQRVFLADCPTHGTLMVHLDKMGHHSTTGSAKLRERYPAEVTKAIIARLSGPDLKAFKESLRGHRRPLEGDVDRWDSLIGPQTEDTSEN